MFEFIITAGEKLATLAMIITIVAWARGPKPGGRSVPFLAPFFVLILFTAAFVATSLSGGKLILDGAIGVSIGFTISYVFLSFFTLGSMCVTKATIVFWRVLAVKRHLHACTIYNTPLPVIVDVCYHNRTAEAKRLSTWL